MTKTALITGASSGIGKELAIEHAKHKGNLVLVARRKDKLNQLKKDLEKQYNIKVTIIVKDLSKPNAAKEIYKEVKNIQIDYLINNAGFGGHGFFHKRKLEDDQSMIDVNISALTQLTHLFLPDMIKRNNGKILNVASMAGFIPGPMQAVYFATKSYVVSLTEALANELRGTSVTCSALCPGPVATEFADVANMKNVKGMQNAEPADKIARIGYEGMIRGKILIVPGKMNAFLVSVLTRVLPRSTITNMSRKAMEKIN